MRRWRRVLAAAVLVLSVAACSETIAYKTSEGRCIKHHTYRIFGLPVNQDEQDCGD